MNKQQFRVLYREFLFRLVDLEILASQGEMSKLLGQFAALLIFTSLWLSPVAGTMAAERSNPATGSPIAWVAGHFLVATTMLVVGLFAVMSWDSTFPDRRDVLVLFPLPIRARTLLWAKIAGVATALGITVLSLNVFTGIVGPIASASEISVLPLIRSFAAYWIATFAAGAFIFCGVLTLQGLAQLLPRQAFLRISALLQIGFFVLLLRSTSCNRRSRMSQMCWRTNRRFTGYRRIGITGCFRNLPAPHCPLRVCWLVELVWDWQSLRAAPSDPTCSATGARYVESRSSLTSCPPAAAIINGYHLSAIPFRLV